MIKCQNMNYKYQAKSPFEKVIFDNVTLEIKGKKNLILGFSGSGKSTFFKILTGYLPVEKNTIKKPKEIILVMQNVNAQIVTDTVYSEINLGYKKKYGIDITKNQIEDLLKYFELDFKITDNPQELSGGQKKLLMVICAIVIKPDLIIFDEPFVGLDLKHRRLLTTYLQETQISILVSSHQPQNILHICDQIVIVNNHDIYNGTIKDAINLEILAPMEG